MNSLVVTEFRGVFDATRGEQREISWTDLIAALGVHARRSDKEGPGWSPASFSTNPCACGGKTCPSELGHRIDQNVVEVSALVIDLDKREDGRPLDESGAGVALQRLIDLGLRFAVHSSHSFAPPERCAMRAVIALSRPVLGPEWSRFWHGAIAHLSIPVGTGRTDGTADMPSRFWYLPSAPEGAAVEAGAFDGAPLDVDAMIAFAPERAEGPAKTAIPASGSAPDDEPEWLRKVPEAERIRRMREELGREPGHRQHLDDDATTWNVVRSKVRRYAVRDADAALAAFVEIYNPKCVPAWPIEKLAHKIEEAYTAASEPRWGQAFEPRPSWAMLGATAAETVARERPNIIVRADQQAVTNEAESALASHGGVYVRGRALVHVVRDRNATDFLKRPKGQPVIEPIAKERLRELLGVAARWLGYNERKEIVPKMVPPWVVETLLARGEWCFPALEGVADAPTLRPDGSILDVPGYDAATRLIFEPGAVSFPSVPRDPTREQAARALDELLEPFCDVPFVEPCHRAAFASLILSILGRGAIDGCVPMFVSGAPTPGSGKGLVVDGAAIIATGRPAPKMAPSRDDEEVRKRLLAIALEAPQVVLIDNVEGALGSPSLAMALTAGEVSDRVLGQTRIVRASLNAIWTVTGNNVALKGDLGRRVVPIEIDPGVEQPEHRGGFRYPNLLEHLRAHRPRLVIAALTVLRGYVAAGRPDHGKPRKGSFEAWDGLVRGAVVWAGGADPLDGVQRIRDAGDADVESLRTLIAAWEGVFGDRAASIGEAIDASKQPGPDARALSEALVVFSDARGGRPLEASAVGYALRGRKGRIVDGRKFESDKVGKRGALWRVVRVVR